ncbi:hypothetical protein HK104_008965 [Borealophlyctis nickersoniae]|nr:hypothetical protein HK104_008965 [Borealophlyctis nickersoniae]
MAFQGVRRAVVSINAHDHKELNILIKEEKDVIKQAQQFAKEKHEATKYLASWGKGEHADLADITDKFAMLFDEYVKFQNALTERYNEYRNRLKEIREKEEALWNAKKQLRELQNTVKAEIKKGKPADSMRAELTAAEKNLMEAESTHEGVKRAVFKQAMYTQFDALMDYGQKVTILGMYGKHLSDQIPQGTLAPGQALPEYTGAPVTKQILGDFLKALREQKQTAGGSAGAESSAPVRAPSPDEYPTQARSPRNWSGDVSGVYEEASGGHNSGHLSATGTGLRNSPSPSASPLLQPQSQVSQPPPMGSMSTMSRKYVQVPHPSQLQQSNGAMYTPNGLSTSPPQLAPGAHMHRISAPPGTLQPPVDGIHLSPYSNHHLPYDPSNNSFTAAYYAHNPHASYPAAMPPQYISGAAAAAAAPSSKPLPPHPSILPQSTRVICPVCECTVLKADTNEHLASNCRDYIIARRGETEGGGSGGGYVNGHGGGGGAGYGGYGSYSSDEAARARLNALRT